MKSTRRVALYTINGFSGLSGLKVQGLKKTNIRIRAL